ncbi:MAG: LysR family transcriptional regulator [Paucibacter sp.]|nr:LysR family transcriptional regulator [Roseateles sp.]
MGRLEDLLAFARVVDARSFSGAARKLGSSKSMLSKQVARLEGELGARLLHRTTRSISATAEGQRVHERALRLLEDAQALEDELAHHGEPSGVLRLSVSTAFGNLQATRLLTGFCARHPRVHVVLGLNDRYVDLAEESFDMVLRLTSQPSPGLVARKLADVRYLPCASPAYLTEHGRPRKPADLERHRCLRFGQLHSPEPWCFRHASLGEAQVQASGSLRLESGLTANSSESLRVAALAGMGIAVLPTYAVGDDLREGRLVPVLPNWQPLGGNANAHTLYAGYLPSRQPSPKVRALIDHLLVELGTVPPWDRGLKLR